MKRTAAGEFVPHPGAVQAEFAVAVEIGCDESAEHATR